MKNIVKLNQANIGSISSEVKVPTYDRSKVNPSIVHIGIGGFHRAHQAYYTDLLLEQGKGNDGICGIGLLKHDKKIVDIMKEQDCLYTLMIKEFDGSVKAKVIGSIVDVIFAPENQMAVVKKMASPETKIISLTITEGGYNLNEMTGKFDLNNPDVIWDLKNPTKPTTVFGFLTQALEMRRKNDVMGCTIQSCDNIQGNGDVCRKMLCSFIEQYDSTLLEWVNANVSFPNSMVDRITPVTSPADIELLENNLGISDAWPVVCEAFIQWVVEDDFVGGRPKWEAVGAQFVGNVEPFENMKLRLLNAGHSVLGILGALHGYNTIDEAASDDVFQDFLKAFMDEEAGPVLNDLEGMDVEAYKRSLIERFQNKYIKDQVSRICLESSAKIPKFLLSTVRGQLAQMPAIAHIDRAAFVVAAWSKYNEGINEKNGTYDIIDAMSEVLKNAAKAAKNDPIAFLKVENVFGDLVNEKVFVTAYLKYYEILQKNNVKTSIELAGFTGKQ